MAKLKGFNRWVTVLLSKTTTVAQVLTWHWGLRDVALQALQVTELKEKQKRHDIHLEQAKLGLIFYQLFAQIPGYGGTSLSSMSWCSAIAHTNVALDFVGKPGVVDRSKIVVRAIQRHAEQSGAGLYRTEAGSEFTVLEKQCPLPHGRPFGAPWAYYDPALFSDDM